MTGPEERSALRDAVRGMLSRRSPSSAVRSVMDSAAGFDRELWSELCTTIGVAGLAVPTEYGGSGAGLLETHVVLDELASSLTPSPMLGSAVLATQTMLHCDDPSGGDRLLPDLVAGARTAALVWTGPDGRWDPEDVACTATGSGRLTGEAHYVLDGEAADTLLVAARGSTGIAVYEVDPRRVEVTRARAVTMDPTRRLATVTLSGAPGRSLGSGNPLPRLRDIACVALSAEQVGAAARALEMTVAHTKTRVQFGRPIGGFQALAHRMADLHVLVDSARSASLAAATAVTTGAPDATQQAAVAKVCCSETLQRVAAEMIQLHGGIGITWEHDAHLFFKRAHGSAQLFGAPREHVARLATVIVDG